MSGRRRHDDGWDRGRLDAQDDGRDAWADDGIGEWEDQSADPVEAADRPRRSSGGAAGGYVRNAQPGGSAPNFPSFQAVGGSSSDDRPDPGPAGQRRSSDSRPSGGHGSAGYGQGGYRDAGYDSGRAGYQSAGYQSAGYGSNDGGGNSSGGRDSAGYDARRGADSAAGRYRQSANNPAARGNDSGYGGGHGGVNSRGYTPEFTPVDSDEADDDGSAATPRPYGRLSIYTLHEDMTREFDRLAERAAEGVRTAEPDTLVYVIHVVPKAPQQRIIYEIYRDRAAFMSHERQPHIRQFAADRAPCVVATNIIDLRLKFAKVASLGSPSEPATQGRTQQQASWSPRGAATQHSPTPYPPVPTPQYSPAQPQGSGARAASFTPVDRNAPGNNQYPTVGRDEHSAAPQYGNPGSGAYGTGSAQYGAANSNGYSGAAGYANGGSYSSSGYPSSNGYPGANANQSASGGYTSANGYSSGNSYQSANGANGYGSGYPNGAANSGGNGAASYSASASTQYAPRYRELTSGAAPEPAAGGDQRNADRYQDDGRQSGRPQSSEWEPRSQGYR